MPIRWRLTLWFSVILCAILVLTGVAIHTILQRHLYNDVDEHLELHAAEAQSFVAATIATVVSAELIWIPMEYHALATEADRLERRAGHLVRSKVSDRDAYRLLRDYQVARGAAPPIPDWLWSRMRGRLNEAWRTQEGSGHHDAR